GIEPLSPDPDCLIAYNLFAYRGPELRLACGEVVRRGDAVLEVHFRREALARLGTSDPARLGLGVMKLADRDIPRLARMLDGHPRFASVRALHAISLFHRGVSRYGFEALPVEPPYQA